MSITVTHKQSMLHITVLHELNKITLEPQPIEWFGLDGTLKEYLVLTSNCAGCSKPHPFWPSTLPG